MKRIVAIVLVVALVVGSVVGVIFLAVDDGPTAASIGDTSISRESVDDELQVLAENKTLQRAIERAGAPRGVQQRRLGHRGDRRRLGLAARHPEARRAGGRAPRARADEGRPAALPRPRRPVRRWRQRLQRPPRVDARTACSTGGRTSRSSSASSSTSRRRRCSRPSPSSARPAASSRTSSWRATSRPRPCCRSSRAAPTSPTSPSGSRSTRAPPAGRFARLHRRAGLHRAVRDRRRDPADRRGLRAVHDRIRDARRARVRRAAREHAGERGARAGAQPGPRRGRRPQRPVRHLGRRNGQVVPSAVARASPRSRAQRLT